MSQPDETLRQFKKEKYWYEGSVAYRFWGGLSLKTYIDFEEGNLPSERQLRVFRSLIERGSDFRPVVRDQLYRWYQSDVYLSMTKYSPERGLYGAEEITPRIDSSDEMWRMIQGPSVWIPGAYVEVPSCEVWFKLTFECCWDEEHGLGVHVQDWKITNFGGSAD